MDKQYSLLWPNEYDMEVRLDIFIDVYHPITNGNNLAKFNGLLWDDNGDSLYYIYDIYTKNPNTIWTICMDGDKAWLQPGWRVGARMGFVITKVAWTSQYLRVLMNP